MEQDYQEAMRLCRELNGNVRRRPVVPSTTRETRASKKALTYDRPTSPTPETPDQSMSFGDLSSSLISPPMTGTSIESVSPLYNMMQVQSPGRLPTDASLSINVSPFTFDAALRVSPPSALSIYQDPVFPPQDCFFIDDHVGQNLDTTWFNGLDAVAINHASRQPKETVRITRAARRARSNVSGIHHQTEAFDGGSASSDQQQLKGRGKKRKADDEELSFQENQSSPESMEDIQDRSDKNSIRKRKAYTKTTLKVANKAKLSLYHENVQDGKPEPVGQPEVWAFKRQQLCETLPYYNAYQSGAYTHDSIARAIMIDKEVSIRDKFGEEVVITSVGGGRLLDESTGKMVYKKDQIFSSTANAFMRAMELMYPVAVIAGQGNKISPSKLPHYYNVLDWFHVTDVWQEKVLGHNDIRVSIWKVRLEKINLSKRSWWAPQSSIPQDNETRPTSEKHICAVCKQESKVKFNIGPTCLNVSCSEFFNFGIEYDDDSLDYHPTFLMERTTYLGHAPGPLSPSPPTDEDLSQDIAFGYERLCKRGIVCQKCGCCSRRIEWRQWSCENHNCDYTHRVQQLPVPLNKVMAKIRDVGQDEDNGSELKDGKLKAPHKNIPFYQSIVGSYDLCNYDLPNESGGISGSIRHFKSSRLINQQRHGPNDLFQEIQASKLDLRRGVAVHKGTTQETLTNHFTQNFGAAYKYLVAQDSKGFDEAPPAVIKAAKRMVWAGKHALMKTGEPFHLFNECLVLGYFDGSKIGYHDDGEKTLGPTVATLSLGANATMNFRPKKKTNIPSLDEGNARGKKDKTEKSSILSIKLEHGDIVIMHGREIQKLYEHEVIPSGGLRFALTCRHINPQTLLDDDERRIAAKKGTVPPGSEQYDYNGDIHAVASIPKQNKGADIANDIRTRFEVGELELEDMEQLLQHITKCITTIT